MPKFRVNAKTVVFIVIALLVAGLVTAHVLTGGLRQH